jgi:hypothetical protein
MDESKFRSLAKWQISVPPRYSQTRLDGEISQDRLLVHVK